MKMTARSARISVGTFGGEFDPRSNSLTSLRLILATMVAAAHAGAIGSGQQPVIGDTEVGALAVDAFFVLSGLLITRSYLQLGSIGRFAWHRILRILPAYYVVLILTAGVVAPIVAALEGRTPWSVFVGDTPSYEYVVSNSLLLARSFSVAELPTGTFVPGVINGSLWTLFYEAVCYAGVVVLGVCGLLRHRWLILAGIVLFSGALALQATGVADASGGRMLRFGLLFLIGVAGWLYRDDIPIRPSLAVAAMAVLFASLILATDYRPFGALAFGYVCLWAVVRTSWLRPGPRDDLSYGVYVFHWPVEVILAAMGATGMTQLGFTVAALTLTFALAFASWRLIERPALSHKSRRPPVWLGRLLPRRWVAVR